MITVYSKNNCPHCVQGKKMLEEAGVEYEEVKIDLNPLARDFVVGEGHKSVPQFYFGDTLFVEAGYAGLKKLGHGGILRRLKELRNER